MSVTGEQLREAVKKRFTSLRRSDTMTTWALSKIREGTATFALVEKYAARLGELLSEAMTAEITEAALPGGMLTAEMAEEILRPLLQEAYEMVTAAAAETMQSLNNAAGLGMKAIRPAIEKDRVDGLIEKIASYESFDQASWLLQEPLVEFTQHVCDRLIEDNVDAHFEAGLSPKVTRKAESGCCKWCSNLDGEYDYPVDREVYRRHRYCRCLVLYDPGDGKVQNAHTKKTYDSVKEAERDARIERIEQNLDRQEKTSVLAAKDAGDSVQPASIRGDFQDFKQLELKEEERKDLTKLKSLATSSNYEHGLAFYEGGKTKIQTDNDHNNVRISFPKDAKHVALYHCHTDDSVLSPEDLKSVLKLNVDREAVISINGDIWMVDYTYGIRPTKDEFKEAMDLIADEVERDVKEDPLFDEWSFEERYYMLGREKMLRLARMFEWDIYGGNING